VVGPTTAPARRAVETAAPNIRLGKDEIGRLVLAVSEAVTNATLHGQPPARMRIWTAPERIVVAISDRGPGPQDPYAGLVQSPAVDGHGGFGLWITHQLWTRRTSATGTGSRSASGPAER
jgi:anti-sigma regulatory factor (Ser/Thr protein kinase)